MQQIQEIVQWFRINNYFTTALLNTIFVPIAFIAFGRIVEILDMALLTFFSKLIGQQGAYAFHNYGLYLGTVHHELAHAAVAALTGATIKEITLLPNGNTLGSVTYIPKGNVLFTSLQKTLASTAPVYLGSISLYYLFTCCYAKCGIWWQFIIFGYVVLSIFTHMNMSSVDVKGALSGLPVCMVVMFAVFYFTRFDLINFALNMQCVKSVTEFFEVVSSY
ncbi:hypothetical protein [Butyrivibrio sp. NC3005]|uniref:hypothetical protein n=1 Tax=Butyrivibrio sp. NC3005 TaxID=1280685 RepID=UPI000406E42A|nr:hypothetical protein [Butyrivibrio sp. NC3005]